MTIIRTDLKIFKPELLGNEAFAGGYRTSNQVVNGKLNDVFSAISDIDHARSSFDMVKLYPGVDTADASKLQDGYVFISDQPDDPLVSTLICELNGLIDAHTLADIRGLIINPDTKFHGSSVITAPVVSNKVAVEATKNSIVPKISVNVGTFGVKGYEHLPTGSFTGSQGHFSRKATFTAPLNSDVAFLSVATPDLYEIEPDWSITYRSSDGTGWVSVSNNTVDAKTNYGIEYKNGAFSCQLIHPLERGGVLTVAYRSTKDYRYHAYAVNSTLTIASNEYIVFGTYRVKKVGDSVVYTDNGEGLFIDSAGNVFAQLDYATGTITPPGNVDLTSTVQENLGCTIFVGNATNQDYPKDISFSVEGVDNIELDTFYMRVTLANDTSFSVSANSGGTIAHTNINGQIRANGYVTLTAAATVDIKRIEYDVEQSQENIAQADWFGFDVSQLPKNGTADIFHPFNVVAIHYKENTAAPTLANNQVVNVLVDADYIDIVDANNATLYSPIDENFEYNKTTGDITIKSGIANFVAPYIITAIQTERTLVASVAENELTLLTALKRNYPIGSVASSVYVLGDMQSLATNQRTLYVWMNDYDDFGVKGSANFNTVQYPIILVNKGTINQKWALVFTSQTAFVVIGNTVGNVASGDITTDLVVINPLTLAPFFTIVKAMFGAGLNPGEAFVFETIAAGDPIVLTRSVAPGHSAVINDSTTLAFFGNQD